MRRFGIGMALAQYVTRYAFPQIVRPQQIAATLDFVAVASFGEGGVLILDRHSLQPRAQVRMDAGPSRPGMPDERYPAGDIAIASGRLFVAQVFSDFVLVVDCSTGNVIERLRLGGEGRLATSADGQHVYFASNTRDEFSVVDVATLKVSTFPFPSGSRGIGALAAHPDGRRLLLGLQRGGQSHASAQGRKQSSRRLRPP